jgi:hypothetical protein
LSETFVAILIILTHLVSRAAIFQFVVFAFSIQTVIGCANIFIIAMFLCMFTLSFVACIDCAFVIIIAKHWSMFTLSSFTITLINCATIFIVTINWNVFDHGSAIDWNTNIFGAQIIVIDRQRNIGAFVARNL